MGWGLLRRKGAAEAAAPAGKERAPKVGPTLLARAATAVPARAAAPPVAVPAPPVPETHWNAKVFDHIEWRRFEAVCEALFAQSGMRAETQSHGADGGVDIWLWSQYSDKPVIVQCKHWKKRVVGVKELREFYGVLKSHDLTYGTFATSSTFSQDALEFARANRINAQDRGGLLRLIAGRTNEQQTALLQTAYADEYWKPTYVNCGIKMIERQKKEDLSWLWGCPNFGRTRCRSMMKATQ
ncbi:restriction endonuclease [Xenophilus arseniciresistens]|uniref:Restriction endonuclease n=1 Tax=Xenophilus arseniciresistens TaxID=1283306 RepID=A0AAE3N859_9BURK|nr:restriction endonuclease [Xenophilus arseniciresistens]MDA7416658.1 restriction endonuclease [Xenophilus arseniciresistens]